MCDKLARHLITPDGDRDLTTALPHEQTQQLRNPMKPTGLKPQVICPLTLLHGLPWHPATSLVCKVQPNLYFIPKQLISQLSVKSMSCRCEKERNTYYKSSNGHVPFLSDQCPVSVLRVPESYLSKKVFKYCLIRSYWFIWLQYVHMGIPRYGLNINDMRDIHMFRYWLNDDSSGILVTGVKPYKLTRTMESP